jgi:hypothetical protein
MRGARVGVSRSLLVYQDASVCRFPHPRALKASLANLGLSPTRFALCRRCSFHVSVSGPRLAGVRRSKGPPSGPWVRRNLRNREDRFAPDATLPNVRELMSASHPKAAISRKTRRASRLHRDGRWIARIGGQCLPNCATISRSLVTYTLPERELGNRKTAENWRVRQDSNLRLQA